MEVLEEIQLSITDRNDETVSLIRQCNKKQHENIKMVTTTPGLPYNAHNFSQYLIEVEIKIKINPFNPR